MALSVSLHFQSERRCKFFKRFEIEEEMVGKTVLDLKTYLCQWCENHASLRAVTNPELKVFDGDALKGTFDILENGQHLKVVYESLTVQLARAVQNEPRMQEADRAFQEALERARQGTLSSSSSTTSEVERKFYVLVQDQNHRDVAELLDVSGATTLEELALDYPNIADTIFVMRIQTNDAEEASTVVGEEAVASGGYAEPDGEPTGAQWKLTLKFPGQDAMADREVTTSPDVSVAKLRAIIAEATYTLPGKATKKKLDGKGLNLTNATTASILDNNRVKVKTVLNDGAVINVTFRGQAGGKNVITAGQKQAFKNFLLDEKRKAIAKTVQELTERTSDTGDVTVAQVINQAKEKGNKMYADYETNIKGAMTKLLHSMSVEELLDVKNFNTNKKDARADGVCEKILKGNTREFAKLCTDITEVEEALASMVNLTFTANFFKENSQYDWKGFIKMIDLMLAQKGHVVSEASEPTGESRDVAM